MLSEHVLALVRRQRVEMAVRLIEATDLKLAAIAAECGFASHAHMTETIGRATGAQPSRLRLAA